MQSYHMISEDLKYITQVKLTLEYTLFIYLFTMNFNCMI